MTTTNSTSGRTREQNALIILAVCFLVAAAYVLFSYLSRPPQMGASSEVFNTVDALYTAVRNRDEKRLDQCELRLHGYRDGGKLPANAADALDGIIRKAKSGSWQPAAEQLYDFMLAQRREGVIESHHHSVKTAAASKLKTK